MGVTNGITTPLIFSPWLFVLVSIIVFFTESLILLIYTKNLKLAICLSAFFNLGSTLLSIPFIYFSWSWFTEILFGWFNTGYFLSISSLVYFLIYIILMLLITVFFEFQLFLLVKNHVYVPSKSVIISNIASYSLISLLASGTGLLFVLFGVPPSNSAYDFFNNFFPNLVVVPIQTVFEFYRAGSTSIIWCLILIIGWNIRKYVVSVIRILITSYRTLPSN